RWSLARLAGLDPTLSTGLPGSGTRVKVAPPLFCSGPSCGLSGAAVVPVRFPVPPKLAGGTTPMRQFVPVADPLATRRSGPVEGPVFSAMIVLWIVSVSAPEVTPTPPPPLAPVGALLPVIVLLRMVAAP